MLLPNTSCKLGAAGGLCSFEKKQRTPIQAKLQRKMSSICRRIHGIFIGASLPSSRASLLSPRTCVSAAFEGQPEGRSSRPVEVLFNEPDLRKMVDKFKLLCARPQIRRRPVIYHETVRRLTAAKRFSWIEEIIEDQKQYQSFAREGFIVRIITLYGKAGMFDHARKLFDEMPQLKCNRTVKSLNALLEAGVKSKKYREVEEIFRAIPPKLSIAPDLYSYNTVIKAYLEVGSLDSLLPAMEEMEKHGVKPNSLTYGMLLDGLYQNGRVSEGDRVWETLESKGIAPCMRCYNSKIRFLVAQKRMEEAVELFDGLEAKGLKPDKFSLCALFKGFREDKNLEKAKCLYKELGKYHCPENRMFYEILVPFATEMGDFEFALELCLEAIGQWNFLGEAALQGVVDGLVKESKVEQAKLIVDSVRRSGDFYGCELKLPLDV